MLPLPAVQAALFNVLSAGLAPIVVLTDGHNQTFPYVTLGEYQGGSNDLLIEEGSDIDATIQVYSRQPGTVELFSLMERIDGLLSRKTFPLTGGIQWVDTVLELYQPWQELDGVTRRGLLRFRISTFKPVSTGRL